MVDVADLAQVSHQTVSRVINGTVGVRQETRTRVEEAILALNYRRNNAAATLASARSHIIGIVIWGGGEFGPANILNGLEQAILHSNYRLAISRIPEISATELKRAFDELLANAAEALIVVVPHVSVLDMVRVAGINVPVLLVESYPAAAGILSAGVDNAQAARLATQHLLDLGHTTVQHLAGPSDWTQAAQRELGWRQAMQDAGRTAPKPWRGNWSARSGYEIGRELGQDKASTAVFVANDQMALGVLRALHDVGRRVPDDVSVVGFDDIPEAEFFLPALTTVHQPFAELGRRAMHVVQSALAGESSPSPDPVTPWLVVRTSTTSPADFRKIRASDPSHRNKKETDVTPHR